MKTNSPNNLEPPETPASVAQARAHLLCDHPERSRSGGNDYLRCGECGFEWDYRRVHDPRPHAIDALIEAVRSALRSDPRQERHEEEQDGAASHEEEKNASN